MLVVQGSDFVASPRMRGTLLCVGSTSKIPRSMQRLSDANFLAFLDFAIRFTSDSQYCQERMDNVNA